MTTMTAVPKGYSGIQIALHWIVAILVAAQFIFNDAISGAWRAIRRGEAFAFDPMILAHVVGGILILAVVVWRIVLRLRHGTPPPPENEPAPLKALSHVAHWGFHVILLAMVMTGLLAWFGDLVPAAEAHEILKAILLALVALHVLAILFHRFVLKNDVMRRMIRPST